MRLEWIEDILAVADTGSLIRAAERRNLSQSAFSRRIRMIEDQLGTELFDRTRKPVELHPAAFEQYQEMRELALRLRRLAAALGDDSHARTHVVIASQHAITTAIAPAFVQRIAASHDIGIRLRSGNRDECYMQLLTRHSDIMLFYTTSRQPLTIEPGFVELHSIGFDSLIPVFAASCLAGLEADIARGELPVVTYPDEVFFGRVLRDDIRSRIAGVTLRPKAETALTLAALQLAATGTAVAWVPEALARAQIVSGQLADLTPRWGAQSLQLMAARLRAAHSSVAEEVWRAIVSPKRS
ncbi:LysR family transcriptional regulator [Paracoccus sp. SY]|uniref:LysR family transcriptional regulator n=1 Tax=Paracoccus sp. SY TaxID=1330255 RepID=UPI000CD01A0B|nr:LysR family transcriptional regulator [Paracoccus sp. SY]